MELDILDADFCYGYIRYVDIFGDVQVSRFCVRFVAERRTFESAGHHNWTIHYTDKNAKKHRADLSQPP